MKASLPYLACTCGRCGVLWSEPDDRPIATIEKENDEMGVCYTEEERQETLKYIEKACNNYEKLVDFLYRVIRQEDDNKLWNLANDIAKELERPSTSERDGKGV